MKLHGIHFPPDQIADFCRRHRIRRLALFGSILRDDFGPDSDIDVLVEFEPEARVGLFRLAAIEQELTAILGRQVDLNTPAFFSEPLRTKLMRHAEVYYAAA